jgi:hypothetical protein
MAIGTIGMTQPVKGRRSYGCWRFEAAPGGACASARLPRFRHLRPFRLTASVVAMVLAVPAAMADSFGSVRYDAAGDQLIVTMVYEGTNSHHHFSVQWGECQSLDHHPGAPPNQIGIQVLDDQGNDAAERQYTETLRIPLASLSCKPARVTLLTEPEVSGLGRMSIDVP